MNTSRETLPVRIQITADDHMRISISNGAMEPVEGFGIEQGFLSGEGYETHSAGTWQPSVQVEAATAMD